MGIKKANVNLLLGKIRTYLDAQPVAKRKGKRFIEAQKAQAKLEKVFAESEDMTEQVACKFTHNALP
ncbi:MAG: hypothetical protein MUC72_05235 [Acidobacteria bacterium]|jgi:hypothetical protein|nr:hypothetical protein [Acidobacteriota bacterium]